ncbi:hypothetical protein PSV08DRAFT_213169 [Bipolaris maydis]|nr:hypothetical protein J3E73DRAFT_219775 [Bipolaris maydis]KAJ6275497.1 hypothetical protein PSV08DRAFT_213169 [Bipolaris maydis]
MTSTSIGEAFQRLPRPQVPTAVALMERSLKKAKEPTTGVTHNPWETLSHLGDLTQGKHKLSLCLQEGQLVIIKEVNREAGHAELEKLKKISDHPNVATIKQVFESKTSVLFQYEYTRFTLEEVLNVHTVLKESHIRLIASADCVWISTELTPNADLEQLGVAVLECMNGLPNENLRDLSFIRKQRESNKMFGLSKGEKWSGYKLLVDFLDSMFNRAIPALAKLEKPVNNQTEGAPSASSSSIPIMPLIESSVPAELEPSFFKFNPTTDAFHPDPVEKQDNQSINDNSYFLGQGHALDIPLVADPQCNPQDFNNFDFTMDINNDASMDFVCINDPIIQMPTVQSLEFSIQILWAEHQMRTQYLEGRLAEAVAVSDSLRKDVDAMAEWIQRIYDHLDSSVAPSAPTENCSQERGE